MTYPNVLVRRPLAKSLRCKLRPISSWSIVRCASYHYLPASEYGEADVQLAELARDALSAATRRVQLDNRCPFSGRIEKESPPLARECHGYGCC
jgi:hypothetical protein